MSRVAVLLLLSLCLVAAYVRAQSVDATGTASSPPSVVPDKSGGHNGNWRRDRDRDITVCPACSPCPSLSCPANSNSCSCNAGSGDRDRDRDDSCRRNKKHCKPFALPAPPVFICEKLAGDWWSPRGLDAPAAATATAATGAAPAGNTNPTNPTPTNPSNGDSLRSTLACVCFALQCLDECQNSRSVWRSADITSFSVDAQGNTLLPVDSDECTRCVFRVWHDRNDRNEVCHDVEIRDLLKVVKGLAAVRIVPPKCFKRSAVWLLDGSFEHDEYDSLD